MNPTSFRSSIGPLILESRIASGLVFALTVTKTLVVVCFPLDGLSGSSETVTEISFSPEVSNDKSIVYALTCVTRLPL